MHHSPLSGKLTFREREGKPQPVVSEIASDAVEHTHDQDSLCSMRHSALSKPTDTPFSPHRPTVVFRERHCQAKQTNVLSNP